MTSREESVLAARDPSINDENDWEEFSLSDVKILFPGKSRYANLLTASTDHPVQVTGCLDEVEEEQESLVIDDDYLSKRIVLANVTHYAYGQHDDGEIGIWVAGRAGWFSISPAKGYKPMFNEMVEAIDLLYFLADKHQTRRNGRRKRYPSLRYLFEEYIDHSHGNCEDADDFAEILYKHHNFLLSRMIKGEEDVGWIHTNIFEHLCERFPEDYEEIKTLLEPKGEQDDSEESNEAGDSNSVNGTSRDAPDFCDPDAVSEMQAETIFQVIVDLKEAGHLAKRQLNLDLVVLTLVGQYEIDNAEYARELIAEKSKIIIKLMNNAKTPSFDWSRKAIYRELKSLSRQNRPQQLALTPLRLRLPENSETSSSSSSTSEESNHEPNARGLRRRVRKSVLRPKSSVSSKHFGKGTRRNIPANQEDQSDDSHDDMDDIETPSKPSGHEFARDPLSTRAKRRTHSILSDPGSTTSTPLQKTPLQETLQTRNTSVSTGKRDASVLGADDPCPNDLPSDTWTCRIKGCGKVVYKSSSKQSKEIIQNHSLAHENTMQKKIDLVFAEQQLNVNLPVDNLIGRIRQFGAFDPDHSILQHRE